MKDLTNGLFKIPSREQRRIERAGAPLNPLKLMGMLSGMQALMFLSGCLAWLADAWDFFCVSLSVSRLAADYGKQNSQITTSITLTLLFRPLGALIAGLISDRYGRKYPLILNLLIVAALSLSTAYCENYSTFLAVRSLFGVAMGGIWGMAAATALENMPAAPRGLFSGIFQQMYALAYLLAASVNLTWIADTNNWRILFYLGAGISALAALVRAFLPESELFLRAKAERDANPHATDSKAKVFWQQTKDMLKDYWPRVIYGILLMTGFNFLSHSSQDLYPTMIEYKLSDLTEAHAKLLANKATIIGNCGAIAGGMSSGYISQYAGRRLTIIAFVLMAGVLIPAWILPSNFSGLAAGAFFIQFGVQGAWGVVPIYLNEISPPAYRATFPGVAYQIGNMVSAASSQIEATGGEKNQIPNPRYNPASPGKEKPTIPDYALVSGILLGVVCAYLICVVIFGREYRGASFEKEPVAGQAAGVAAAQNSEEDLEKAHDAKASGSQGSEENVADLPSADLASAHPQKA